MRVTVSTPEELAAVIPHLMGFTPTNSVVVMPMGPGLPVARIDLPTTAEERDRAADALLGPFLRNAGADSRVALVCYSESGRLAEEASRHISDELSAHGLPVQARLWVSEESWTDLTTGVGGARTGEASSRMAAEFVAEGHRSPARSREDLAAAYAGDTTGVATLLPAATEQTRSNPQAAERAWVTDRIDQFERDGQRFSDPDATRVLVAIHDIEIRDDALMRMNRDTAVDQRALWTDLTARAPQEVRTPAATLAGFAAWLSGDGAGAWTALDQIPQGAAGYRLAGMLGQLLEQGVHPSAWDNAEHPDMDRAAADGGLSGPQHDPPDVTARPHRDEHDPSRSAPSRSAPSRSAESQVSRRWPDPPRLGAPPSPRHQPPTR